MDIFPTIAAIVGLPDSVRLQPQDGVSLLQLFTKEMARREKPIPFSCLGNTALLDNNYKLIRLGKKQPARQYELYDLANDPKEETNLYSQQPELADRMRSAMEAWEQSMNASVAGKDYPEGRLLPGDPEPRFWTDVDAYRPYFDAWKVRPEYQSRLRAKKGQAFSKRVTSAHAIRSDCCKNFGNPAEKRRAAGGTRSALLSLARKNADFMPKAALRTRREMLGTRLRIVSCGRVPAQRRGEYCLESMWRCMSWH